MKEKINGKKYTLKNLEWPNFGSYKNPVLHDSGDYISRINLAKSKLDELKLTHLVIYGDKEHFANLMFLTGFDPRFEEALLIISKDRKPIILVGNECEEYLKISPLYNDGKIRKERFQPFSLLNQPADESRPLSSIFLDEGINASSSIGCVGWKYFMDKHGKLKKHTIEIPSFIIDELRNIAGFKNVINATGIFMDPGKGFRTFCNPADIAFFEYSSILGSEGMKKVLTEITDNIIDYELVKKIGYTGLPLSCHICLLNGSNYDFGLPGPDGNLIKKGEPFAMNISYWGSNICRAGWVVYSEKDLPDRAKGYIENFAGIYFKALARWFGLLKIGITGKEIINSIEEELPFKKFGIYLNPGHLIHLDEWVSSPIFKGSEIPLHSGMYLQSDIIPNSRDYFTTRAEDGYIIADKDLRMSLKRKYPDVYKRCQKRRSFMIDTLGIEISDEVLPLSNIPALIQPYLLNKNRFFAIKN
jgi:hypothetical protein